MNAIAEIVRRLAARKHNRSWQRTIPDLVVSDPRASKAVVTNNHCSGSSNQKQGLWSAKARGELEQRSPMKGNRDQTDLKGDKILEELQCCANVADLE